MILFAERSRKTQYADPIYVKKTQVKWTQKSICIYVFSAFQMPCMSQTQNICNITSKTEQLYNKKNE